MKKIWNWLNVIVLVVLGACSSDDRDNSAFKPEFDNGAIEHNNVGRSEVVLRGRIVIPDGLGALNADLCIPLLPQCLQKMRYEFLPLLIRVGFAK